MAYLSREAARCRKHARRRTARYGFVDADVTQRNRRTTVFEDSETSSSAFRRTPQAPSI